MTDPTRIGTPSTDTVEAVVRGQLAKALGGRRGMAEEAVPTILFTVTWLTMSDLNLALSVSIGAALVLRLGLLSTVFVIVQLTEPVFTLFGRGFSWRDMILIAGGLFLVWKATKEIHHAVDPTDHKGDIVSHAINVSLGGGLSKLAGRVFRIGHLGDLNEPMILGTLAAVEMTLKLNGVPHAPGGVGAAMARGSQKCRGAWAHLASPATAMSRPHTLSRVPGSATAASSGTEKVP